MEVRPGTAPEGKARAVLGDAVVMPKGAEQRAVCQESCSGRSISVSVAQALRGLVLGADRQWDASWMQPFVYTQVEALAFGLVQNKVL